MIQTWLKLMTMTQTKTQCETLLHKYATVQSDMLDQDYGMNCDKI